MAEKRKLINLSPERLQIALRYCPTKIENRAPTEDDTYSEYENEDGMLEKFHFEIGQYWVHEPDNLFILLYKCNGKAKWKSVTESEYYDSLEVKK